MNTLIGPRGAGFILCFFGVVVECTLGAISRAEKTGKNL
jgi:hypothetical protein